ncbi:MAG: AMP phosphorylase [Candidatus Altiarchaeota archaeon]|nr:AMP phosphorylase [Candidatus Altiarchaeota archaeon]
MFKVKKLDVSRDNPYAVVINNEDAKNMNIHLDDRVEIFWKGDKFIAVTELCDTSIRKGEIGFFKETVNKLNNKLPIEVGVKPFVKPKSVGYIKKRLMGDPLKRHEIKQIVYDLMENKLSSVEASYFVASAYVQRLSFEEEEQLARSIVSAGETISFKKSPVLDKHSIGGVPGNRTTLIVVPIVAAAGYLVPKTSSRAITSPAGTADVLEVLCNVVYSAKEMKALTQKHGAAMIWGGSVNLAPVDDILLKLRYPLRLDPPSFLLASILAKKKSVGADKVLIDIPLGAKVKDIGEARNLAYRFKNLGKTLDMDVHVLITDGYQPIGNGVGPSLEARDVLRVFEGKGPVDLTEKSLKLAGEMLEMAGKKNGYKLALNLLETGKAYEKFKEIIQAQGGDPNIKSEDISIGKYTHEILSDETTNHIMYDSDIIAKLARLAGAPAIKGAGVDILELPGSSVKAGQKILRIHTPVRTRLEAVEAFLKDVDVTASRNVIIDSL